MKTRLLSLLIFLLPFVLTAQAQDAEPPLILWIRGDLYRVGASGEAPQPLTSDGTISGPVLSPDGRWIAYKAAAPLGMEALSRVSADGFIADFDLPGDIYLLDLTTNLSEQIAGQPADASLFVAGAADKAIIRSTPVWSPDGLRLAWTAYTYPGGTPQIVAYDLASGAASVFVADVPAPLVQGAAPALKWGSGGIAVNASTDTAGDQEYLLYGDDGALRSRPRLAAVEGDPVVEFVWVEGINQLGLLYASSGWILIDPTTGQGHAASEPPRLTTAQPGSRSLRFGVDPVAGFFWEVVGETVAAPGAPAQVTLSPSGTRIAFIGFPSSGAVSVLTESGDPYAVPQTGSNLDQLQVGALLWGYTYWHADS